MIDDFPKQIAFAAHFGGYTRWQEAKEYLAGCENVFYDTSSSLPFMSAEEAKALVSKFGAEKLFFGTDFPMWKHTEELERFMNLNLTNEENKAILADNFKKFFDIK